MAYQVFLAAWKTEKLTASLSFGSYFTISITLQKAQSFQIVIQIGMQTKQ